MKKKLLFIIISVVLLITVVFNVYAGEAADKLLIEYKDDLLTLMIKDTLLKEVLDEIGHKTGVKVTSHDLSEQKITVEFHALPLDEGIRKVIGPHNNSIFFYEEKKGEDGSPLLSKLTEVRIFPKEEGMSDSPESVKEAPPVPDNTTGYQKK